MSNPPAPIPNIVGNDNDSKPTLVDPTPQFDTPEGEKAGIDKSISHRSVDLEKTGDAGAAVPTHGAAYLSGAKLWILIGSLLLSVFLIALGAFST